MSEFSGYIPDGYTFKGFIKGVPRLFPDVRLSYRQTLTNARAAIRHAMDLAESDPVKVETIGAQTIATHVTAWDLKKPDGTIVPLTVAEILRLQPMLERTIFRIVMGDVAPDEDPTLADADKNAAADEMLRVALSGESREVADIKNSKAG